MRTLPVAHLAAHASRIVKEVQGGDRVTITVRGEPVAVMVSAAGFVEAATCKRCRSWEKGTNWSGACRHPQLSPIGIGKTGAAAFGASVIETAPDFGCVNFEGKDK